jgi:hypothetical protein
MGWFMLQTSSSSRIVPLGSSLALEVEEVRVDDIASDETLTLAGVFEDQEEGHRPWTAGYCCGWAYGARVTQRVGRGRSQVKRLSQEIEELDGIKAALSSAVKALQEIERREQAEMPSHVRTAFFRAVEPP